MTEPGGDTGQDWELRKLSDVADVIGGGTPSTADPENFGGDIAWVTPKDLSTHLERHIGSGERSLTKKGLTTSSAKLIPTGSVLVSTRAPIGLTAISTAPLSTNQGCRSLVPKPNLVDTEFLYYLMSSSTEYLHQHANGTTFQELPGGVMKELEFLFPSLPEQRAIASVLGALDERLSLCRTIESTLSEVVIAECQVAFDARSSTQSITLPEAVRLVNGGAYTKGASNTGRMVVRIKELNSGPSETTVYNNIVVPEDKTVNPGDVLFAWSGSLGVWRWYRDQAIVNQHIFKIIPNEHPVWLGWVHVLDALEDFRDIAAGKATTMGHITKDHLVRTKVPKLSDPELAELAERVEPLWEYQLRMGREIQTLTDLRDFLLPRLLSGELRVAEAEEAAGALL